MTKKTPVTTKGMTSAIHSTIVAEQHYGDKPVHLIPRKERPLALLMLGHWVISKPAAHQTVRSISTEQLYAQACNGLSAPLHLLTATSYSTTDSISFSRALARAMHATTASRGACAHAEVAA